MLSGKKEFLNSSDETHACVQNCSKCLSESVSHTSARCLKLCLNCLRQNLWGANYSNCHFSSAVLLFIFLKHFTVTSCFQFSLHYSCAFQLWKAQRWCRAGHCHINSTFELDNNLDSYKWASVSETDPNRNNPAVFSFLPLFLLFFSAQYCVYIRINVSTVRVIVM